MTRQQAWNIYEAAILLDAYLETLSSDLPRLRIIERVSAELRQMANNNGQEIDNIFRNENGISFQMRSMESAFCGKTVMKPATQLFADIVTLYNTNRPEYEKILMEAKSVVNGKRTVEDAYMSWLSSKVSPNKLPGLLWAYKEIEQFCLKICVLHAPLFETTDLEMLRKVMKTVEQNKIFRITHKKQINNIDSAMRFYFTFIKEYNSFISEPVKPETESAADIVPVVSLYPQIDLKPQQHPMPAQLEQTACECFTELSGELRTKLFDIFNLDNIEYKECHEYNKLYSQHANVDNKIAESAFEAKRIINTLKEKDGYAVVDEKNADQVWKCLQAINDCMRYNTSWQRSNCVYLAYRFLENFRWFGKAVEFTAFNAWGPLIFDLNKNQLSYYLWWRENAKKGVFHVATGEYLWLYINDIVLNTCLETASESLSALIALYEKYPDLSKGATHKRLSQQLLGLYIPNYARYNGLTDNIESLTDRFGFDDNFLICLDIEKGIFEGHESYLMSLTSSAIRTTTFMNSPEKQFVINIISLAFQKVHKICKSNAINIARNLVGERKAHVCWVPYDSPLLAMDTITQIPTEIPHTSFYCCGNTYSYTSSEDKALNSQLLGNYSSWYHNDTGENFDRKGFFYRSEYTGPDAAGLSMVDYIVRQIQNAYRSYQEPKKLLQELECPYKSIKREIDICINDIVKDYTFKQKADLNIVVANKTNDSSSPKLSVKEASVEPRVVFETTIFIRSEQDKRLLNKYPIIYKRVFVSLREMSKDNHKGVAVVALYDYINHVARCADIEDILDNVSWARCDDKKYTFSEEVVTRNIEVGNIDTTPKMLGNVVILHSCARTISSDSFYKYLHDDLSMAEATCRSYVSAIGGAERFAKEHCFEHQHLFTPDWCEAKATADALFRDPVFTEYNDQQHNRFRAAIKKLLLFMRADAATLATTTPVARPAPQPVADESYRSVLVENFRKGFRLSSPIELRKFKRCYEQMNNKMLDDEDVEIESKISICGILFEDKVFIPQTMLGDELREQLFTYIKNCFSEGKTVLYYQALFNEFSEEFLDYYIYNADMLKAYLSFMLGEDYFFGRSYFAKDANASADPVDEIRTCLKEYAAPMTYDVMFENLSHIPQEKIKQILACNGEFISNGRGEYFHVSAVHFSDEEKDNISVIIAAAIEEKQFLSGNELVAAIRSKYPYTYENNSAFSVVGLRDTIKYHLSNKFSFSGNIISKLGSSLTMSDVFADYCRSRDSFMLDELNVLANELGTTIYFDPVYENSLRINHDRFVSKKCAHFLVPETDAALDRFCTGDYISIGKISEFSLFPNAGFPWNEYLLEHYTATYSDKYSLLHIGYNANKCVGAIVKKCAGFESFDDCIVDVLANSNITLKKQSALQYLCDEGYIARHIYTNIEKLLIRATAQRNRKEAN